MTERQKKLDHITDVLYFYVVDLASKASDVESLGLTRDGEDLRSVADQLERIAIRLLDRMKNSSRKKVNA